MPKRRSLIQDFVSVRCYVKKIDTLNRDILFVTQLEIVVFHKIFFQIESVIHTSVQNDYVFDCKTLQYGVCVAMEQNYATNISGH
ncbi:hypothetical protein ABEY48_31230 [Bacillus mycoides]